MSTSAIIDTFTPAVGLIVVLTTTIVRRRAVTNVSFGSGFLIDGEIDQINDSSDTIFYCLRNQTSSSNPIVVSVAHVIPTQGDNLYRFKLFDPISKISKIYSLNLVAFNRATDIAIFSVLPDASGNPFNPDLCLQWNSELDNLVAGTNCYVVGYPLGNSQLSIADGCVRDPTYCFSNSDTGIDQIYHSVPSTNGNSGSCILDGSGRIIGIHAWGLNQYQNVITFENFCGGPSGFCAKQIITNMISQPQNIVNKYYARYGLGVQTRILDDIFRILNIANDKGNAKNIEGIIIESILTNQGANLFTVNTYNRGLQTPKIAVGDIITHIYDNIDKEWIPIGYTQTSPGLVLFRNTTFPAPSSIKIRIRQKSSSYNQAIDITFTTFYKIPITLDATNNRII